MGGVDDKAGDGTVCSWLTGRKSALGCCREDPSASKTGNADVDVDGVREL